MALKQFITAAQWATFFSSNVLELQQAPERSNLNILYSLDQGQQTLS